MYHAHLRGTHREAGFRWGSLLLKMCIRDSTNTTTPDGCQVDQNGRWVQQ